MSGRHRQALLPRGRDLSAPGSRPDRVSRCGAWCSRGRCDHMSLLLAVAFMDCSTDISARPQLIGRRRKLRSRGHGAASHDTAMRNPAPTMPRPSTTCAGRGVVDVLADRGGLGQGARRLTHRRPTVGMVGRDLCASCVSVARAGASAARKGVRGLMLVVNMRSAV